MTKKEIIKQLGKPKIDEMMTEDQYWSIIQNSIENSCTQDEQEYFLKRKLSKLSLAETIGFMLRTDYFLYELYSSELWCAATIINDTGSDDLFLYFRAWIISRGKRVFQNVKKNPDCLINYVNSNNFWHEFETFMYIPYDVFEIKTNQEIYNFIGSDDSSNNISSTNLNDDIKFNWSIDEPESMRRICPKLFHYFNQLGYLKDQYPNHEIQEEELCDELKEFVVDYGDWAVSKHSLVYDPFPVDLNKKTLKNWEANYRFQKSMEKLNLSIIDEDFEQALFHVSEAYKLEFFFEYHEEIYEKYGEEKYYQIFRNWFQFKSYHHYCCDLYSEILEYGNNPRNMMDVEEKIDYGSLPAEITIYRGISYHEGIDYLDIDDLIGNSWTLNIQDAKSYINDSRNNRFSELPYSYILKTRIPKSDVIAYFTENGEHEIFVDFETCDFSELEIIDLSYEFKNIA